MEDTLAETLALETDQMIPPFEVIQKLFFSFQERGQEDHPPENVSSAINDIQTDARSENAMDIMLRMMQNLYAPALLNNTTWPESIKKDFIAQMHRFLASLTETTFRMRGSTVLYVPIDSFTSIEGAAKDKELVQRLEASFIHWSSQIKTVIDEKDTYEHLEDSGPLAEIEYWKSRLEDLNNLKEQIQRPEVQRIVDVLDFAKSSYLPLFLTWSNQIQQKATESSDNLNLLQTLQEPSEELTKAAPKDIPRVLPNLLTRIHDIFSTPLHYLTPERLTSLLKKVSNEIISRCCAKISLHEVFEGDVISSMLVLQQSTEAGECWKVNCDKTFSGMQKRTNSHENAEFDERSVFAEVDAFIQRCRDLIDICEGQIQFDGRNEGGMLPVFGGTKGPEVTKGLADIRSTFKKLVHDLGSLDYDILDVKKATRWHDDYGAFKNGVKDLEVLMQNLITSAWDHVNMVETGVELLEGFSHFSKWEVIRRSIQSKTADLFNLFKHELDVIQKEFDSNKKNPPLQPYHPQYVGAAIWAQNFLDRIHYNKERLDVVYYLPHTRESDDAEKMFNALNITLQTFIKSTYSEWHQSIEKSMLHLLDQPIMLRAPDGLLEINFDPVLLNIFEEARYWQRLRFDVPWAAMDIGTREDKLRITRENVGLVVRDYNNIIQSLSPEETRLFKECIVQLDKKIRPGLESLYWSSKGVVQYFIKECRKQCRAISETIADFKNGVSNIFKQCKIIADTLLVEIEKWRVYTERLFAARQREHRENSRQRLRRAHGEIVQIMNSIYQYFRNDNDEIQREWRIFISKIEKKIDESLRQSVKKSLQEISRAINGDKKTDIQALFLVNVVLDSKNNELRPLLKPSVESLSQLIQDTSKDLIAVINIIPPLLDALREAMIADNEEVPAVFRKDENKSSTSNVYDNIRRDNEIVSVVVNIVSGMQTIDDEICKYLYRWEKYKQVWSTDKDAFIRRFAKKERPLANYELEINKYKELQTSIQNEDSSTIITYLQLDSAPLKNTLTMECNTWQDKFTSLMNEIAEKEFADLY